MENWRLKGLMEAARNLARGLENMAGEHVEPSPPPTPGAEEPRPPLTEWWLEARLQALEEAQRSPQSSPLPLSSGERWYLVADGELKRLCKSCLASLAVTLTTFPTMEPTSASSKSTPSTASGSELT